MLFSEPKIPQSAGCSRRCRERCSFSALQRAENSSIPDGNAVGRDEDEVSVLFSEPKIPQFPLLCGKQRIVETVSVLFSEPKIPQFVTAPSTCYGWVVFQCSSASRKFLNMTATSAGASRCRRFSALQRAENSSIRAPPRSARSARAVSVLFSEPKIPQYQRVRTRVRSPRRFQCSSASRKFLNSWSATGLRSGSPTFQCSSASRKFLNSAADGRRNRRGRRRPIHMFQCSSASRKFLNYAVPAVSVLSQTFQCSSASRKFLNSIAFATSLRSTAVSVLFSEPKIPQSRLRANCTVTRSEFQCSSASRKFLKFNAAVETLQITVFQCSSASRKFLNVQTPAYAGIRVTFQCSSASRKFLNRSVRAELARRFRVSVLFSEPKIPQRGRMRRATTGQQPFQCSSASRKFLNRAAPAPVAPREKFQCSSASRKFLTRLSAR